MGRADHLGDFFYFNDEVALLSLWLRKKEVDFLGGWGEDNINAVILNEIIQDLLSSCLKGQHSW